MRRKISDEMIEAITERLYERINLSNVPWKSAQDRERRRYYDAAHSVLLLADEYWKLDTA